MTDVFIGLTGTNSNFKATYLNEFVSEKTNLITAPKNQLTGALTSLDSTTTNITSSAVTIGDLTGTTSNVSIVGYEAFLSSDTTKITSNTYPNHW